MLRNYISYLFTAVLIVIFLVSYGLSNFKKSTPDSLITKNNSLIIKDNSRIIKDALEADRRANADLIKQTKDPLVVAVGSNNVQVVQELLQQGIDPNVGYTKNGYTKYPLMIAAENGNIEIVKSLLKAHANHDIRYGEVEMFHAGVPLVAFAIKGRSLEIVHLLIDAQAEDLADYAIKKEPDTPRIILKKRYQELLVNDLVELHLLPTDIGSVYAGDGYRNCRLLNYAIITYAPIPIIQALIDYGADINANDYPKTTPLMSAAMVGNFEATQLLLKAGANPSLISDESITALYYAEKGGYRDIVQLLKSSNNSSR